MGLENITRHITLDISVHKYISVPVKQYDINTREIIAKITNDGKPYLIDNSIIPRIKCKKCDDTHVVNDCTVLETGEIKIDITEQMTACDGLHMCELALFDTQSKKVLHTVNFVLNVRKAVCSDDEITSSDEYIALENALLKMEDIIKLKRITENEIDILFS